MNYIKFFIFLLFCSIYFGCSRTKPKDKIIDTINVSESNLIQIDLSESNPTKDEAGNFLLMDSYIRLSDEELISSIERILIEDERIYIFDGSDKIVCFDMSGNVLFSIKNKGKGPKEYVEISDFALDKTNDRVVILDNGKRKLIFYDSNSGDFLSETSYFYNYYSRALAIVDGKFYFSNPDKDTHGKVDEKEYYLLFSETGNTIDNQFLLHDAISEFNFRMENGHPFFYNGDKMLYNRAFDGTVYELMPDGIEPIYEINLPNQLPISEIESKIQHHDLVRSNYSFGISDIFEGDSILHINYSKNMMIASVFYDIKHHKLLYNGFRVLGTPRKDMPFYYLIRGVYKNKFYSIIPADMVVSTIQKSKGVISKDLMNISDDDNPIIAFYKIVRKIK